MPQIERGITDIMKEASANSEKKRLAGEYAATLIENGMTVGIGTGSTVFFFVKALKKRMDEENLEFTGVVTSFQTRCLCEELGIKLVDVSSVDKLDIAVDGADEVDPELNGIKGGGAAQTIEKVVAGLAEKYVFIIDETKKVSYLGETFPIPVEVIPQAWRSVRNSIKKMGFDSEIRIAKRKDGPVITDNGNFVLDVTIGRKVDIDKLNKDITMLPGVLETGLFIGYGDIACVGTDNGVEVIRK